MKNFKSHTIKITPDQAKSYFNAAEAIEDCGFEQYGIFENFNPVRGTDRRDVYRRISDGRLFVFAGMEHYNTTIYYIKMRELTESGERCI